MNNRLVSIVCGTALIVATCGAVFAADMAVKAPPPAPPPAVWDWSGFYIGVGGSFNWTHFDQSLQGVSGTINVFNGPVLIAQGQEGGPFFDFDRNKFGFAPDVQLGYMYPFAGGDWLAGLKFNVQIRKHRLEGEREHSAEWDRRRNATAGTPDPSPGSWQISPAEINLKHQLSLIATIGRAFGNVTLYAGGGPALFGVETNFINGIPFAVSWWRDVPRRLAAHRI